jgi:hypothetical protein
MTDTMTLPASLTDAANRLLAARRTKREAEAIEKAARTTLLAAMGEATLATLADGRRVLIDERPRKGYYVLPCLMRLLLIE